MSRYGHLIKGFSDMDLIIMQHEARQYYPEDKDFCNEILIELGRRQKEKNVRKELETNSLEEGSRA